MRDESGEAIAMRRIARLGAGVERRRFDTEAPCASTWAASKPIARANVDAAVDVR